MGSASDKYNSKLCMLVAPLQAVLYSKISLTSLITNADAFTIKTTAYLS
jgi:hypothetical protein